MKLKPKIHPVCDLEVHSKPGGEWDADVLQCESTPQSSGLASELLSDKRDIILHFIPGY